jgi:aspartate aminotransferase-like enzyme
MSMTTTEESRFFVPGPTWVRPEILAEMTRPMIGHRSAEFKALFVGIRSGLKMLFETQGEVFVAAASGTGVLEAAMLNCVPRRVLVTTCGAFSERWLSIAQKLGLEVDELKHEWGEAVDPERLADHLAGRRQHYDAVTITHNETSTGVINDLAALAAVVHEESPGTLVLVDAVSSLGGTPVRVDEWKLDVVVASVQKGIALPPGITVFATSENALAAAKKRPYRGTYFDFLDFQKNAALGSVPFTPSVPHCYALAKQLEDIAAETVGSRFARHEAMRDLTIARTAGYARLMSPAGHASPTVSALTPTTRSPETIRAEMKQRGFTLGGGYGNWKDNTFRIGHMGDISVAAVTHMLDALDEVAGS